jgi:adenine-specific DNA methylase
MNEKQITLSGEMLREEIRPVTYKGIYNMHKYWSKKPPNIVAFFIERFSRPGEIILDPFSGYGVTGIEALRLKRKAIIVDLNPIASFISKNILNPISLIEIENTFKKLKENVERIKSFYRTHCPHCGSETIATHYIHENESLKKVYFECARCKKRGWKEPSIEDINLYQSFSYDEIPFWYPKDIKLFDNSRINSRPDLTIRDFFTARNLHAASFLYYEIEKINNFEIREFFKFVFTGALPQMSNMVFVIRQRGKFSGKESNSREEVGSWVIGYWIPEEHFEINVWRCFENRYKKIVKGKKEAIKLLPNIRFGYSFSDLESDKADIIIKTHDATDLSFILENSIDYIFTDPPHGDRIPYFELSSLWASWLKFDLDFENEIVISDAKDRNKDIKDYKERLYKAFKEMYRVLKPRRYISIAFNNLTDEVWFSFLDIITSIGFELVEVTPMHYSAGSVVQDTRKGGLKSDFIFTCIKREKPFKSYIYNLYIEKEKNLKKYVSEAINIIKKTNKSARIRTYHILNIIIPQLIKEGKAFRISEILKLSKQYLGD